MGYPSPGQTIELEVSRCFGGELEVEVSSLARIDFEYTQIRDLLSVPWTWLASVVSRTKKKDGYRNACVGQMAR